MSLPDVKDLASDLFSNRTFEVLDGSYRMVHLLPQDMYNFVCLSRSAVRTPQHHHICHQASALASYIAIDSRILSTHRLLARILLYIKSRFLPYTELYRAV